MERGEAFFDAINTTSVDEILERSKRVNKIAATAAVLAGEKLQLEGDGDTKRLVFAAYLAIDDISTRVVEDNGIAAAESILTDERTYQTLLDKSATLSSSGFDKVTKQFKSQGAYLAVKDGALVAQENVVMSTSMKSKGCPYAQGNPKRMGYFVECTDHAVRTYLEAYKRDMPRNLAQAAYRLLA